MDRDRTALLELELAPPSAQASPRTADPVICKADIAECTCPDFCERDHTNE